jgi:glyoxylate carboligase
MSDNRVSDVLAQAFAAEGVDTLFTLMGDANMYWSASMADNQKVRLIHARHEHCCVAMADAYARATGKVGVGSVTCGPGYTQIMTALAMAARGNAPVLRIPTLATPMAPMRLNSSSTTGTRPTGRSRPYQRDGQCGTPHPDSASLRRHSTSP